MFKIFPCENGFIRKFLLNVEEMKYSAEPCVVLLLVEHTFNNRQLIGVCSDIELSLRLHSDIPVNSRAINVTVQIPLPTATCRCHLITCVLAMCLQSYVM